MSRGHGRTQHEILELLADGPASSTQVYREIGRNERGVRQSLDRLWLAGTIEQHERRLEHGVPIWCLPGDAREHDPHRELPRHRARATDGKGGLTKAEEREAIEMVVRLDQLAAIASAGLDSVPDEEDGDPMIDEMARLLDRTPEQVRATLARGRQEQEQRERAREADRAAHIVWGLEQGMTEAEAIEQWNSIVRAREEQRQ